MSDGVQIRIKTELDDSKARQQMNDLKELGNNMKINIDLGDITSQLNKISQSLKNAFKIDGTSLKDVNKITNALKEVRDTQDSIGKKKLSVIDNNLMSQYKTISSTIDSLNKQMSKKGLGEDSIKRTKNQVNELEAELSKLYNKMSSSAKSKIDLFNTNASVKNLTAVNQAMSKIEKDAKSMQNAMSNMTLKNVDVSSVEKINNQLKELRNVAKQEINPNIDFSSAMSQIEKLETQIKQLQKLDDLNLNFDKMKGDLQSALGVDVVQKFENELKQLGNTALTLDGSFDRAFNSASSGMREMQSRARTMNTELRSTNRFWSDFKGSLVGFTAGNLIGDGIARGLRSIKDVIIDTDKAMVNLGKVAPQNFGRTTAQIKQFQKDATTVAKDTGKTTIDIIDGTANAMQAGIKNVDQAMQVAKQSAIFANVGDMQQDQADRYVKGIMSSYGGMTNALKGVSQPIKGAGKEYNNLQKMIDMANYSGNNFAVTTADIGEILMQSSSSLSNMGVSMEQATAMGIAMNETLQDSSRSGNALKSIGANLSGVMFGLKKGDIQANKSAKTLEKIAGIKIWDEQTGEIKDMYSTLDELSGKWKTFTDAERNTISNSLAGKTQANAFNAMMNNWSQAQRFMSDFNQGMTVGSAMKENDRYLDSISGKLNKLKESLKGIATSNLTSNMVKGALDGVNAIVGGIEKVSNKTTSEGLITTMLGGASAISMFKKGNLFKNASTGIKGLTKQATASAKGFSSALLVGSKWSEAVASGANASASAVEAFARANDGATASSRLLSAGTTVLKGAMVGLAVGGVALAGKALYDYSKRTETSIKQHKENIAGIQEDISARKQQVQGIKQIAEEYDTLAKKTNKTAEETQRFSELKNQVAELAPELFSGKYDANGDPILNMKGSLSSYIAELDRAIAKQERLMAKEEKGLADDYRKEMPKLLKEMSKAEESYYDKKKRNNVEGMFGFASKGHTLNNKVKDMKKRQDENLKEEQKYQEKRLEQIDKYNEMELGIQQDHMNKIQATNSYKNGNEASKLAKDSFASSLNWAEMDSTSANKMARDIAKLDGVLVNSTQEMGKYAKSIDTVEDSFGKNGSSRNYTKGLTDLYKEAKKFDAESLNNWMQGMQQNLEDTGNMKNYKQNISDMASALHDITGLDQNALKKALTVPVPDTSASEKALERFLNSYGTTVGKMDAKTNELKAQFEGLSNFHSEFMDAVIQQEVDVEFLVNAKNEMDLPTQVESLIDGIISDGNVTEVEQNLMLALNTEILNGGEITEQTANQIEKLYAGQLSEQEIKAGIKIGNFELKGDPLKELNDQAKKNPVKIDMDADHSKVDKATEAVKKAKEGLSDPVVCEIEAQGLDESADKINLVKDAIKDMPEEKQTEFIAECSDAISKSKDMNELVKNLPDSKKLKYDIGVTGDAKLETAKQQLESMPDQVKTAVYNEVIGIDQLNMLQQAQQKVGNQTFTSFVKVEGAMEALAQCKTVEEAKKLIEGVTSGELVITANGVEEAEKVKDTLNEVNNANAQATAGVEVENNGEVEQMKSDVEGLDGTNATATANMEVNGDEEIQQAKSDIESFPTENKTTTVNFKVEGKDELESAKQAFEAFPTDSKTTTVKFEVQGKDQLESAKQAIEVFPKGTQSITISANVSGMDTISSLKGAVEGLPTSKSLTVTANTAQASQNITGLKSNANSVPSSKNMTFNANTAQASKNITGLKTNANSVPSGKTLNYNANTAQASKNISGLIAKCNSVPSGKTITYRVVTSYSTVGSPTKQSGGWSIGGRSAIAPVSNTPSTASVFSTQLTTPQPIATRDGLHEETNTINSRATSQTPIEYWGNNVFDSIEKNIELFKELENRIKAVGSQLSILDKKMENAIGADKVRYLEDQKKLLEEQLKLQNDLMWFYQEEQKILRDKLQGQGFQFNADGNLTNYEEKLLAMEREADRLEKIAKDASDKSSDYEGNNESTKKSLDKKAKDTQKAYDDYRKKLDEMRQNVDEYIDISFDKLPGIREEWEDLKNELKDVDNAQKELCRQTWHLKLETDYADAQGDLDRIQSQLDIIDEKLKGAIGTSSKEGLLSQQISLMEKYQKEAMDVWLALDKARNDVRWELSQYGFGFDADGSINNLTENMEKLKWSLSEDDFELMKKYAEEYAEIINKEMPNAEKDIESIKNEIKDAQQAMKDLAQEKLEFNIEVNTEDLDNQLKFIKNEIDLLEEKMKNASGQDKIDLLEQQIYLWEKYGEQLKQTNDYLEKEKDNLKSILGKEYGFKFDSDGDISNYIENMKALKESLPEDEFNNISKIADEYMDILLDKLPDAIKESEELKNTIKDLYKEQLEITKDIEGKITDIYKKEIEDRKKALQDETDERIKQLKKQQDAYNDMRKEQDWKDDLEEQSKVITDLEAEIARLSRDDSIGSKKKLQDLLKQLEEEQKKLQDMTQDKIDDDMNKYYEDEMDRLEEETDKAIKDLEDKWSDSAIAEAVKKALETGIFTDIDGKVTSLKDKMLEFAEESGEAFGVMGDVIKNDLIGNLEMALETMRNLEEINSKLDLKNFGGVGRTLQPFDAKNATTTNNKSITFGDTNITVNGGSEDVTEQIKEMIEESQEKMLDEILKYN